jgi:hypothetical protein
MEIDQSRKRSPQKSPQKRAPIRKRGKTGGADQHPILVDEEFNVLDENPYLDIDLSTLNEKWESLGRKGYHPAQMFLGFLQLQMKSRKPCYAIREIMDDPDGSVWFKMDLRVSGRTASREIQAWYDRHKLYERAARSGRVVVPEGVTSGKVADAARTAYENADIMIQHTAGKSPAEILKYLEGTAWTGQKGELKSRLNKRLRSLEKAVESAEVARFGSLVTPPAT